MTHRHAHPHFDRGLLDARLHLLDRQIRDADGEPVGAVDDLELDLSGDPPRVTAVLTGRALMYRLIGAGPGPEALERLDWTDVERVGVVVRLRKRQEELSLAWPERWLRERVLSRIPGHDGRRKGGNR